MTTVATISERGVVRASGADAASYLQGQISQDVDQLETGRSAWSLLLQPAGKLTAWFRLHRLGENEFLLDVDPESTDDLVARLERFKLRTNVEFVAETGWRMLSVRGSDEVAAEGLVARFEWPEFSGVDVLAVGLEASGEIEINDGAFEDARIRATVPRMGIDLDADTIPAEGGAPLIDTSVSFTKGCYTGQELVARVNSRGANVPRPLRTLLSDSPLAVGASVQLDGTDVGTITSARGGAGLGRILRKAEPGSMVTVDGESATIQEPSDRLTGPVAEAAQPPTAHRSDRTLG